MLYGVPQCEAEWITNSDGGNSADRTIDTLGRRTGKSHQHPVRLSIPLFCGGRYSSDPVPPGGPGEER